MPLGNVSLTPQLVQAVRDAADIVAVASDHTRLRKAGRRYQGLCPLHKEKTPSFSVDPVQGLFYCFGCGAGGDAIKLHMLASGDDFPAAIEALAQRYGIPLPARTVRAGGTPERDLEGALGAAARFFAAQLRQSAAAQRYLAGRRVSPELIERFGLGYAPDSFQALIDALTPRVSLADLEAAGLVGRSDSQRHYDRFRHRLMFPIHNQSGRLVGFGGRTLGDDKAKYINTAETERFHKGHLLYGLSQARQEIREERRAVLVEGYFDVIATVASGRTGTVAGMGTALTQEQARLLARYADEVVVAYDGDRGGEAAVAAAIDAAEDGVVLQLRAAIPAPMASARLKATQAGAVAALLEPIRDSLMRSEYARRAAEMLGVPEKEFLSRLKELKGWRGVAEAPSPGEGSAAAPGGGATGPHLVRSLEEQVLSNLLQAGAAEPLPALAELPSPAVFFDPECRNIYTGFRTLYAEGGAAAAGARAVLARVASQQATVDRMAQILLEGPFDLGRSGLSESLAQLVRRWRRQRLRELLSEIGAAQRQGDQARLTSLLEEKTSLSQSLHRGGHSGVAGGEDR